MGDISIKQSLPAREVLPLQEVSYICTMGNTGANGHISDECKRHFKAIQDTQDILSGKWKMLIMGILGSGKRRYLELQRMVAGIGPKMLSKELQELEINGLVSRTVMDTKPLTVEYALTAYGTSLKPILDDMAEWGKNHRDRIIRDMTNHKAPD